MSATIDPRRHHGVVLGLTRRVDTGDLTRLLQAAEVPVEVCDAAPGPAVLVDTAARLTAPVQRCAVITDSAVGVQAARDAGFALVIGVGAELGDSGADVVVGDLADIVVRAVDRRMSTLPDALDCFDLVGGVVAEHQPAVLFDFDGTLSDIVADPAAATPTAGAADALGALATHCPVAVVSGRSLEDIRTRVGVTGLWYAGSHGFEICAPDGSVHRDPGALAAEQALHRAAGALRRELAEVAGVVVEDKRFAVAVHYRGVEAGNVGAVAAAVHRQGDAEQLRITRGRKVIELRPDIEWNKGATLKWIVDQVASHGRLVVPIFVGDDLTDEDAFDVIRHDGVGIIVAHHEDGDRATDAQFALEDPQRVVEFTRRLADRLGREAALESDAWSLTFEGYCPGTERLREVLCTTGNGYLATRGCAPDATAGPVHYPGTYTAGLFNRLTDHIAGVTVSNESMVNLPNWLPLSFQVEGGPWFDVDTAELLSYRQTMDLRRAELTRELTFRDPAGRVTGLRQQRIVAMHRPHLAALKTTLVAQNWSGTFRIRSVVDGGVRNAGVDRYRELSGAHLDAIELTELSADSVLLSCQTTQSRIPIAVAMRSSVRQEHQSAPATYQLFVDDARIGHDITVQVRQGETVTVEKVATVSQGREPALSESRDAATRWLNRSGGYDELRTGHVAAWAQLWDRFDVYLGDGADTLRVIRLHMLHLLQTISPHTAGLDVGVPARGLHGEAYRGHVFWDELFVIPVLNLRLPMATRALLQYRYRRLAEARCAARDAGYRGAMFPWQSGSDGREESQRMHLNPRSGRWNPDASAIAHHVGSAIAYDVWHYYQVTGDLDYLIGYGAELLVEIARFWVSRTQFDDSRGRYVIRGVIGPDEFHSGYPGRDHGGIDNNAYTNVMAVWTIMRALDALASLPLRDRLDLLDSLELHGEELASWDDVSRRMFVPFHDGVISQFEGYGELPELDWDAYRRRYGDIQRLDRLLEAEGDDVNNYRASKQADVLMLFYLLSADELREVLLRLGYGLEPEQIPRTVDYYFQRTSHGSTLSAVVHSWVLARGNRDQAMSYFRQVLESDVADIQGGTTAEGIHLAAMAGSIDLLQRCYSGLETRGDRLVLGPMWPEEMGTLGFSIWYRGNRVHLRILGRSAEVSADPGGAAPMTVECRGQVQKLEPGHTIHVC